MTFARSTASVLRKEKTKYLEGMSDLSKQGEFAGNHRWPRAQERAGRRFGFSTRNLHTPDLTPPGPPIL